MSNEEDALTITLPKDLLYRLAIEAHRSSSTLDTYIRRCLLNRRSDDEKSKVGVVREAEIQLSGESQESNKAPGAPGGSSLLQMPKASARGTSLPSDEPTANDNEGRN